MESEAVCEGIRRSASRPPTRGSGSPMVAGSKLGGLTPLPMSPDQNHINELLQEAKKDVSKTKRKMQRKTPNMLVALSLFYRIKTYSSISGFVNNIVPLHNVLNIKASLSAVVNEYLIRHV